MCMFVVWNSSLYLCVPYKVMAVKVWHSYQWWPFTLKTYFQICRSLGIKLGFGESNRKPLKMYNQLLNGKPSLMSRGSWESKRLCLSFTALLKMGEYYWYGHGSVKDTDLAIGYYVLAARHRVPEVSFQPIHSIWYSFSPTVVVFTFVGLR